MPGHHNHEIAREALRRGALIPVRATYAFGRRHFSRATIKTLIDDGTARRLEDGRVVSRAAFPTTMSGNLCPRCHVRYLPLDGRCICQA